MRGINQDLKIDIENSNPKKLPSPSISSPHLWGRKKVGGILSGGNWGEGEIGDVNVYFSKDVTIIVRLY